MIACSILLNLGMSKRSLGKLSSGGSVTFFLNFFNKFILWAWLVSVLISIRVARRFGPDDFIEALVDRNEGYASRTILSWVSVVSEEFADSLRIIYWFFIISSLLIRYFCYWARRANENWFLFFGVILRGLTLFRGSWHRDHQSVLSKSLFLNIYSDSKLKNSGIL